MLTPFRVTRPVIVLTRSSICFGVIFSNLEVLCSARILRRPLGSIVNVIYYTNRSDESEKSDLNQFGLVSNRDWSRTDEGMRLRRGEDEEEEGRRRGRKRRKKSNVQSERQSQGSHVGSGVSADTTITSADAFGLFSAVVPIDSRLSDVPVESTASQFTCRGNGKMHGLSSQFHCWTTGRGANICGSWDGGRSI